MLPLTKRCPSCTLIQSARAFHYNKKRKDGLAAYCKKCCLIKAKMFYAKHRERMKEKERARNATDDRKRKHNLMERFLRLKNLEKYREKKRIAHAKRRLNPMIRANSSVTRSISYHIGNGRKNWRKTEELLGYSMIDLYRHLENLFTDGMSWDNYGEWQIDHKRPVASFKLTTHANLDLAIRECWALSNLQPLWKKDNQCKNAKWNGLVPELTD